MLSAPPPGSRRRGPFRPAPLPRGASGRGAVLCGGVAATALGWLASEHPGLRFVDAIGFARRAEALPAAVTLGNKLYPLGYPVALRVGHAVTGDVLVAGKALTALAGGLAVAAAARLVGVGGALALLASVAALRWGATEGTDMPAAALGLAALAAALVARGADGRGEPRDDARATRASALAGVLAAAACLTRYTALPVAAIVLVVAPRRIAALAPLAIGAAVHAGGAWVAGISPVPDQSENLVIAGGGPPGAPGPGGPGGAGLWADTLRRWPAGAGRALATALEEWPARIGAIGLLVGAARRDTRAFALVAAFAAHVGLLGLAFSNPRLALPATLLATVGWVWLVPWAHALAPMAALGVWLALPAAQAPDPVAASADQLARALAGEPGPIASTSAWTHLRRPDGWLDGALPLSTFSRNPRALAPDALGAALDAAGVPLVALDATRVRREYAGVRRLYDTPSDGWSSVTKVAGVRVLRRDGVVARPRSVVMGAAALPGAPPPRGGMPKPPGP